MKRLEIGCYTCLYRNDCKIVTTQSIFFQEGYKIVASNFRGGRKKSKPIAFVMIFEKEENRNSSFYNRLILYKHCDRCCQESKTNQYPLLESKRFFSFPQISVLFPAHVMTGDSCF